jgi:hypothetical protein
MNIFIRKYGLYAALLAPFDPDAFLQQAVDGPLDTEYKLVPVGEYKAMIDDFTSEAIEVIDFTRQDGTPGSMTKFNCPFVLDAPQVALDLNRQRVVVPKQMILDLDDAGKIATGPNRNIELGRVRKAVGQETTQGWGLPMLRNAGPCMVKVEHRSGVRKQDGSRWERAEVTRVMPIVGS